MNIGGIVVIDGPDGTGKETVVKNILKLANDKKVFGELEVLTQTFPNYPSFYGRMVRAYLDGDSAPELIRVPEEIRLDPICASAMYALDRYQTFKNIMKPNIDKGHWYICDRYYTSNMGHQGSRMETLNERIEFFDRLMWLELKYCQLPEPNAVVILDLPEDIRRGRTESRRSQVVESGNSTGKVSTTDIHEQDPIHMRRAAEVYRQMAAHFKWPLVNGFQNGRELDRDEMADRVFAAILTALNK